MIESESDSEGTDCQSICSESDDNVPELPDIEDDELSGNDTDDEELFPVCNEYIARNGLFNEKLNFL